MTITIKLFAAARDLAGIESVSVNVTAEPTVAELRHLLGTQIPSMASMLTRSAIAVNHEFADDAVMVRDGDEVAVIPPVSGG